MSRNLDKVSITRDGPEDMPWQVWIPPRGPIDYEGQDTDGGAIVAPYGDSFWPDLAEACAFVERVTNDEHHVAGRLFDRKANQGIDCTEDESAWIKRYFDRHHPLDTSEGAQMADAFPLEKDEWFEDEDRSGPVRNSGLTSSSSMLYTQTMTTTTTEDLGVVTNKAIEMADELVKLAVERVADSKQEVEDLISGMQDRLDDETAAMTIRERNLLDLTIGALQSRVDQLWRMSRG